MSQKLNKKGILQSTYPLSKYENDYILFNFRFTLITKDLDANYYQKIFKKIINFYSNMTIKQFSSNNGTRKEYNKNILERQKIKNNNFVAYLKEKYDSEFKFTYDIYRENNGMRAYGALKENIFYLLEIDPKHDSR